MCVKPPQPRIDILLHKTSLGTKTLLKIVPQTNTNYYYLYFDFLIPIHSRGLRFLQRTLFNQKYLYRFKKQCINNGVTDYPKVKDTSLFAQPPKGLYRALWHSLKTINLWTNPSI